MASAVITGYTLRCTQVIHPVIIATIIAPISARAIQLRGFAAARGHGSIHALSTNQQLQRLARWQNSKLSPTID